MKYIVILFFGIYVLLSFQNGTIAQDAPIISNSRYLVKISVSQCRIWLYEKTGEGLKLVREHKAGTAKVGLKRYPLGLGYITDIDFAPVWKPTGYTRWYFARKGIFLPSFVPFGHKLNYMGAFRISISHFVPGKGSVYRIHGVRAGDEECIGKRVSGGCVRMLNVEGIELAKTVSVGTPVEIIP